jgi:hypothetical protein
MLLKARAVSSGARRLSSSKLRTDRRPDLCQPLAKRADVSIRPHVRNWLQCRRFPGVVYDMSKKVSELLAWIRISRLPRRSPVLKREALVRVGIIIGVWSLLGVSATPAQAGFLPATSYNVGTSASAIGTGDFTGDQIPDLIVARPAQDDIIVMPGRPNGTFGPALPPINVGQNPVGVTSCTPPLSDRDPADGNIAEPAWTTPDFNADGICDVAVTDAGSRDIAVLKGNGDGTFSQPLHIPVDGSPGAILAMPMSGNRQGIVFSEPAQNRIGTIWFLPDGTYVGPTWTAVGSEPDSLAATLDWTDGEWQLAVADAGSNDVRAFSSTYGQDGGPSWDGRGLWQLGSSPTSLTAGSFGFAVAERNSNAVVILGPGRPTSELTPGPPITVGTGPVELAALSIPGDPASGDLAVLSQVDQSITLLRPSPAIGSDNAPTFTATTLPYSGRATVMVAEPFRAPLDTMLRSTETEPSDLALLDAAGNISVALQDAPRFVMSPPDFGTTVAGTTKRANLTITNIGQTPQGVDHVSLPSTPLGNPPFRIGQDGCRGQVVAPGASCTLAVLFSPLLAGAWPDEMIAYGGSTESSAFAVARFQATATLIASVSSPTVQSISVAADKGLRASARCSAACTVTVQAFLVASDSRPQSVLGISSRRLQHGGLLRFNIRLSNSIRALARMRRAKVVLRPRVEARSYRHGVAAPVTRSLRQLTVMLYGRG